MSEMRSVAVLRSTLIGFGVLAFTFFPPTRTLMLWGVCVQIAVMLGRMAHRASGEGSRDRGPGADRRGAAWRRCHRGAVCNRNTRRHHAARDTGLRNCHERALRRRLHVPRRALSHDEQADVRALLSLPLVPARDRHFVRAQRADRSQSRGVAARSAGSHRHAFQQRQRSEGRALSRLPNCAMEQLRRGGRCRFVSCVSARSTSRTAVRPTFTSSLRRNSRGLCCRQVLAPCPSTTAVRASGPRRVWRDARLFLVEEIAMLQLRPNCECCDKDLPADSAEAHICSFECTFCTSCVTTVLKGKCPNCGGELVARPRRPADKLAKYPASTQRVLKPQGCAGAA